jgi:hypothetical protein
MWSSLKAVLPHHVILLKGSAPTPSGPHALCRHFSSLGCRFLLCFSLYRDLWLHSSQTLLDVALSKVSQSVHQSVDSSWVVQLVRGLWIHSAVPRLFCWVGFEVCWQNWSLSESSTDVKFRHLKAFFRSHVFHGLLSLSWLGKKNLKMFTRAYYMLEVYNFRSKILQNLSQRSNYGIPKSISLV